MTSESKHRHSNANNIKIVATPLIISQVFKKMRLKVILVVIVFYVSFVSSNEESDGIQYSNSWAVHVNEENQGSVNGIATKHGFINRGQIGHLPGYYLFEKEEDKERGKRSMVNHTEILLAEPKINWAEQQRVLERSKRNVLSHDSHAIRDKRDMAVSIQDPYFKDQWYLENIGQSSGPAGLDINVLPVWARGYSGKGVVVSILDDGVDHTHPDLVRNYDSYASIDLNTFDEDPMPRSKDPLNCHGTRCAGEVAAEANNGICGVGVSFNASIGGIRMLDGPITDTIEGMSLSYHSNYIDIYTCCWGPKDDGKRFGKPGTFASKALKIGTEKGRGGKGNIFVWATGNGGLTDDDCNCDGYTTSIYTVSIGAISDHGLSTYYTETCASTIAVTFSGASHREADENKIVSTDLDHKCTETFKGTSSAAPLATGMLALVLEANPNLTWRDVQHLIVETSQKTSPLDEGWTRNGAGKLFNHKFGFGKLDTMKMIEAALKWKNVAEQRECKDTTHDVPRNIPSSGTLIVSANTSSCTGSTSLVRKLEHVQIVVTLKHRRRGDLTIMVISPSGTRSQLLKTRRNDNSSQGLKDWVFMTVHFWGEDPKGLWSLVVTDNDRNTREHHVIKAKQGDMEDVQRVVMDDTEKRGHWDSRVINEYDRTKHGPPGSPTTHDHILKTMEDTTGELVKGNKFVELAKRKKNRKNRTLTAIHHEHAQKASKITKVKNMKNIRHHDVTNNHKQREHKKIVNTKSNMKHHNIRHHDVTNNHKKREHKKIKFVNTESNMKHDKKYFHHQYKQHKVKKVRKHKFIGKRKHMKHTHRHTRKHKDIEQHKNKPAANDGKANDVVTKPLMADGSLEIPSGSSLEAKLALQAFANPIIEKIMGITKSNFVPMNRRHHNLVGEVDIKMRLIGNGNNWKRAESAKSQPVKGSQETKASGVQKQQDNVGNNQSSSRKISNVYITMLNSINAPPMNDTTSQVNSEHLTMDEHYSSKKYNGSVVPGHMSNGSEMKEKQNLHPPHNTSAATTPMIFYDDDTKQYVTVKKVGAKENTNSEAVIIASEKSGSGSKATGSKVTGSESGTGSQTTGSESEHTYGTNGTEESGSLVRKNSSCEESSDMIDCLINKDGKIMNSPIDESFLVEEEDDDNKNKLQDDKKNKTKGPPDDFGAVDTNDLTGKKEEDDFTGKNEEDQTRSENPGNGSENLGNGNQNPGYGSKNTGNGSEIPEPGSEILGNGSAIPGNGSIDNGVKEVNGQYDKQSTEDTKDFTGNKGYETRRKMPKSENKFNRTQERNDENQINVKPIGTKTRPKQVMPRKDITKIGSSAKQSGNGNTGTGNPVIENRNEKNGIGNAIIESGNGNTETGNPVIENGNKTSVTGSNVMQDEPEERNDANELSLDGPIIYNTIDENYLNNNFEGDDSATQKPSSRHSNTGNGISGNRNEKDKKRKAKGPKDDMGSVTMNDLTGKDGSEDEKRIAGYRKRVEKMGDVEKNKNPASSSMRNKKEKSSDGSINPYSPLGQQYRKDHFKGEDSPSEKPNNIDPRNESEIVENGKEYEGEKVGNDDEERGNENRSGSGNKMTESGSGEKEMKYGDNIEHSQRGDVMIGMSDDISNGSGNEVTESGSGDKERTHGENIEHLQRGDYMPQMSNDSINGGDDDITGESVQSIHQLHNGDSQDIEGSSSGMEPFQRTKERPSQLLQDPTIFAPTPVLEEAPVQLPNGTIYEDEMPSLDLSQIPKQRRPSLDQIFGTHDRDVDPMPSERYTRRGYTGDDQQSLQEDSLRERDLAALEKALQRQISNLKKFQDQEPKNMNFLQRVKQDIRHRNIPDLERLEDEVRDGMGNPMSVRDANGMQNDENSVMDPRSSHEEPHGRVRRETSDDEPKDDKSTLNESTSNKNENGQEHSGILESWNLIFYGT